MSDRMILQGYAQNENTVRLLRFKADLVKRPYLQLCYWDLDILYTKWKLAIVPIRSYI